MNDVSRRRAKVLQKRKQDVIDPAGQETLYAYDHHGLLIAITDAKGGMKRLEWNAQAQLAAYTEFDPESLVSALDPERLDRPPAEACSELSERATGLGGTVAELAETMVGGLVTAIGAAGGRASSCS